MTTWLFLLMLVFNYEYGMRKSTLPQEALHGPPTVARAWCAQNLLWADFPICRYGWEPLAGLDWKCELAEKHIFYTEENLGRPSE